MSPSEAATALWGPAQRLLPSATEVRIIRERRSVCTDHGMVPSLGVGIAVHSGHSVWRNAVNTNRPGEAMELEGLLVERLDKAFGFERDGDFWTRVAL